ISFLYFFEQSILLKEIFVGCFLPVVCFIPGFYAVSWAVDRPFRPFMIAVFGGMLIRLVFIGIVFVLIVTLTKLHVSCLFFSIFSKHVLMMWIAAALVVFVFRFAFRKQHVIPSGLANLLEAIVVFLRDEVILPNIGEEGRRYLPYLLTVFFFILFCNLLGLI